jgi:predicted HicB family RNase H-like nuclease
MTVQPNDKYVLRLPDGMRDQIKEEADRNGRSMNAEIIHRLNGVSRGDDEVRITLRLPRRVHAMVSSSAERSGKSLNGEIVGRLEATFSGASNTEVASLLREALGILERPPSI